jgi:hypothetical protein
MAKPMPSVDEFSYYGFRPEFPTPSPGKISNVSTNIFVSIFRDFSGLNFKINLKNTFDVFPEEGIKNCSRKP